MKYVLIVVLLSSCSIFKKEVRFKKDQELLESIKLSESSNETVQFILKKTLTGNLSKPKFKIINKRVTPFQYNQLILLKSKEIEESNKLNMLYKTLTSSKIFEKIEKLKLQKINKDYHSYLRTFFKNKNNTIRRNLIKSIIDIDFPSMKYINLVAQTVALSTKYDNLYDQINYYSAVKGFLSTSLYNVNIYLYKKTPTALLKKLYNAINTKQYKETRIFAEKIQELVHKDIINRIIENFNKDNLLYADLKKVKKGASLNSPLNQI